jgi:hypothetical protein
MKRAHRAACAAAFWSAAAAACNQADYTPRPSIAPNAIDGGVTLGGPQTTRGSDSQVRIEILTPAPDVVLKHTEAPEVKARITSVRPGAAGEPIDPASPRARVIDSATDQVLAEVPLVGPGVDATYVGRLSLAALATGTYPLVVVASTVDGKAAASASLNLRIDHGPRIRILSPGDGSSYKGSLSIKALIEFAPFGAGKIEATIGTNPVTLEPGTEPDTQGKVIVFEDFRPPLIGEQLLRISAVNSEGTRGQAEARFTVDLAGPVISNTAPGDGQVVGNVVRLRAQVADPAGVLGASVVAIIGDKTDVQFKIPLDPEPGAPGFFSALFDTQKLTSCDPDNPMDNRFCNVFPNLSFRAEDLIGNASTVAYDFAVDNHPPVLDLDPGLMRLLKFDPLRGGEVCSRTFDPVGNYRDLGDMPNDQCGVAQTFELRSRIEDLGNPAAGLKFSPISRVNPDTVAAFVLGDPSQPLVVDSNGDGVCDAINPKLVPTTMPAVQSNEVLKVRLGAVKPDGAADYREHADRPAFCMEPGAELAPRPLCLTTTQNRMTVAVGYTSAREDPEPSIWAIEPITKEPWCVGAQFDGFANEMPDGKWLCVATMAVDNVGNVGVSRPLRVWLKMDGAGLPYSASLGCHAPGASAGPPPDCTGKYDMASGQVQPGTCKGLRFAEPGVVELRRTGD